MLSWLGLDYVFNTGYQPHNLSTFPKTSLTPLQWYFQTKLRPKVLKKMFLETGPTPLSKSLDDQVPVISKSGSGTALNKFLTAFMKTKICFPLDSK